MIVINIMLGRGQGGIENSFVNYCRCLLMYKHEVHAIIAPQAAIEQETRQLPGVYLHPLNNHGAWDIFAKWRLKKIVASIQPDIILVHANRAMSLIMPLRNQYTIIPITHNYSIKRAIQFQNIISITEHLKNTILSTSGFPIKVFVLPNTIPMPLVETESRTINIPILGAMGRFVPKKGLEYFIRALAILKNHGILFSAIIAGQGEEELRLKTLTEELGLAHQLSFKAWMPPSDFFNSIDIFCLPSLHEPFGIVLIEAFAHAKAVVCTNTEGPNEIAQDQVNALIVQRGNAEDLAHKLTLLINNPALREKLANNAKQSFIKNYALEAGAKRLEQIIGQITKLKINCKSDIPRRP